MTKKITEKHVTTVCDCWRLHEDDDISTEKLLEMCRNSAGLRDVSDVLECLKLGGIIEDYGEQTND